MKLCPHCGLSKPREAFRKRATLAQKKRWNKDWITSKVCDTCRKPVASKPVLGPVGLFKKLTNMGLPTPIIEHRVAQRAHVNKTRRVAGLRKTWREKHKEANAACLAALDSEATKNRQRLTYLRGGKERVTARAPVIKALTAYSKLLSATRAAIKENATAGRTPPNPWHNAITKEQKLELIRVFNQAIEETTDAWARAYAGRALPSWWSE